MFVKFSYGCKNIVFELNTTNLGILIFSLNLSEKQALSISFTKTNS